MTNEEMIKLAKIPDAVAHHEALNRLIWIARNQEQKRIWAKIGTIAIQEHDAAALSSYPPSIKNHD
jgi:hypothetical protein